MSRVAIVTGGSRGIGRATVEHLAADGWNVAFTHRQPLTDQTARESVIAIDADVSDTSRSAEVVERVLDRFGRVDALVNNAGIRSDVLLYNMPEAAWSDVIATNLTGCFAMSKAVLPAMMRQRGGAIVNVASLSGLHGVAGQTNYAAAKGGVIALTRSLARETGRSGIRVNCVAPGLVETEMISELSADAKKEMLRMTCLRRLLQPQEIAAAIAFLLSDRASGITGQVLCVDAGASA